MSSLMTSSGCRRQRREIGRALLAAVAYGALAFGSPAVLAQSGDVAGDASFLVPEETCNDLRDLVDDNPGNTEPEDFIGDIIIVCDTGDETGRRSCEVLSGSTTPGESAGQGIGFCADRFPNGLQLVEGQEPLKTEIVVEATSFGAITGTTEATEPGLFADIVCETFVDDAGVRRCREVVEDVTPSEPEDCGDDFIITPPSAASFAACDLIEEELADSVTAEEPDLAFALFIDIDTLGEPGSEALFSCQTRQTQCFTPGVDEPEEVVVDYQVSKILVREDPDCVRIGGRRYC
jgi:hypothetical protein